MNPQTERIYWSIREVADQTGLAASNIRYWEQQFAEFPQMQVYQDRQGNHHYTKENIRFIKLLRYLRDEQQITRIEAMKRWITSNKESELSRAQQISETLQAIRTELVELRKLL